MRRQRLALVGIGVAITATAGSITAGRAAASPTDPAAAAIGCFHAHQGRPFASLDEARACIPGAPLFQVSPTDHSGGLPPGFLGAAVTQNGSHYTAHYFTKNTTTPQSPPVRNAVAAAYVVHPSEGSAASPPATLADCYWYYWNNFNTDNWSFGSAGGSYTPTLWADEGCWYTVGSQNNFYVNWAAYSWPSWNEGTYDSNWANDNGYGFWGADWVNGDVQTSPASWNGFWCRGELYADGSSYWYPGCNFNG